MKTIITLLLLSLSLTSCAQISAPPFWRDIAPVTSTCDTYRIRFTTANPPFQYQENLVYIDCFGNYQRYNITTDPAYMYVCASQMISTDSPIISDYTLRIVKQAACVNGTDPALPPEPEEPTAPIVPCGTATQFSGGQSFPSTEAVQIGSATGTVTVTFDPRSAPDKMIIKRSNGQVVLNTGYRTINPINIPHYQNELNKALADRGLPSEPLTLSPSQNKYTFNKNFTDAYILIEIYAPLGGTVWQYQVDCL